MKNILKKVLPRSLKLFLLEHRYMFKVIRGNYKKELKKLFRENENKSLKINDPKKWIKKINKLVYSDLSFTQLGKEFMKSEITILKQLDILNEDIVLMCVEKNDIIKLKKFISHHRTIGVDKFIIIDNDSTDGTVEYLLKQKDVFLLQTKDLYTSIRREAWINRVIAYFGDNRWYLVLDSDELLVYNDYENRSIKDVIKYLQNNKIIRARALLLDMYAKEDYYEDGNVDDFYDKCVYFDTNTYHIKNREDYINICGGSRERVFDMSPCLTKYPIFYFRKKDIHCRSHYLYSYKENFKSDCQMIIMHYKFLPGEIEKYREIVKNQNYFRGSWAYKKYLNVMEETKKINFMYKSTCKYSNSSSFNEIDIYKKINWNGR